MGGELFKFPYDAKDAGAFIRDAMLPFETQFTRSAEVNWDNGSINTEHPWNSSTVQNIAYGMGTMFGGNFGGFHKTNG